MNKQVPDSFARKIKRVQDYKAKYPHKPERIKSAVADLEHHIQKGCDEIALGFWVGKNAALIESGIEVAREFLGSL